MYTRQLIFKKASRVESIQNGYLKHEITKKK